MGRCHHPETWLSAVHDTLVPIQLTVAMCNLFLMAIRDPSVTPGADTGDGARPMSPNVLFISFAINAVFWAYIVYGAFRFQRALWLWLQDGAPEHVIQSQEEV